MLRAGARQVVLAYLSPFGDLHMVGSTSLPFISISLAYPKGDVLGRRELQWRAVLGVPVRQLRGMELPGVHYGGHGPGHREVGDDELNDCPPVDQVPADLDKFSNQATVSPSESKTKYKHMRKGTRSRLACNVQQALSCSALQFGCSGTFVDSCTNDRLCHVADRDPK